LIHLNDKYTPLFNNETRFFIVTGGRGSAKSFATTAFCCALSRENEHKILYTRQTMSSAHLSIIPEFQEKIDLLEMTGQFSVNKAEITHKGSNSEILFRGLRASNGDQTANLKSLQGITTWVLDEAEELTDEDKFDTIQRSIRSNKKQNRIILILNPATKEHWIFKRFFEQAGVEQGFNGVKGNVTYIHTSYLDNVDNLPQDYLNDFEQLRQRNPNRYNHIVMGGWLDKAEGVVFTNWKYGAFNPDNLQTSCGMDFGFSVDPDTLTEVAIDKVHKKIYLKEHIYQKGIKTHVLAPMIKDRVGSKLIIADSAEPRLIEDLRHAGVNIQAVKKGTIESGIVRMQDFEIIVEPNSTNIGKELNNHAYADKGSKLYIDDWNHAIDGARYNITYHLDNPTKGQYFIS
jgi:phage terminase large subunit